MRLYSIPTFIPTSSRPGTNGENSIGRAFKERRLLPLLLQLENSTTEPRNEDGANENSHSLNNDLGQR